MVVAAAPSARRRAARRRAVRTRKSNCSSAGATREGGRRHKEAARSARGGGYRCGGVCGGRRRTGGALRVDRGEPAARVGPLAQRRRVPAHRVVRQRELRVQVQHERVPQLVAAPQRRGHLGVVVAVEPRVRRRRGWRDARHVVPTDARHRRVRVLAGPAHQAPVHVAPTLAGRDDFIFPAPPLVVLRLVARLPSMQYRQWVRLLAARHARVARAAPVAPLACGNGSHRLG